MARPSKDLRNFHGFALIEAITVVGILVLLGALIYPALSTALAAARRNACASNLHQLGIAAIAYATDHNGEFPWGCKTVSGYKSYAWDFVLPNGESVATPGEIWDYTKGNARIMQCPAFIGGKSNWTGDPYTGYNYNCSFIGKVQGDSAKRNRPAKLATVRKPGKTALFGDGEYSGGANKFMRSPKSNRTHDATGSSTRLAGTQGFRHRGYANIVFCDGHVESIKTAYNANGDEGFTSPGCGFISPDNSLYSLE